MGALPRDCQAPRNKMIRPYRGTRKTGDLLDGDIVLDLEYRREHNRRVGQLLSAEAADDNRGLARQAETARLRHRIKGWLGEHESMESLAAIPEPAQRESDDRQAPWTRSPPRAHQSRRRHGHADTNEGAACVRSKATHTGPSWYQVRMRMLEDASVTQATRCCDPPAVVHGAACCLRTDGTYASLGIGVMGALSLAIWAISTAAVYAI